MPIFVNGFEYGFGYNPFPVRPNIVFPERRLSVERQERLAELRVKHRTEDLILDGTRPARGMRYEGDYLFPELS